MNDQSAQGVLELHPKGYGFLRSPSRHYVAQQADPYVPAPLVQKHRLREGMLLAGPIEAARKGSGPKLVGVAQIESDHPEAYQRRNFDELTHIAQAVTQNHPEMHVIMLLIDERPEEVTDMRRTVKGEVVASNFDHDTASHIRTAELVVERAKRLAEQGKQAFVLLDSLTRLARVYNKKAGNSGRTMSGGIDVRALEIPKRLFGTARAFEEGGSLTIMGTALIETGSRMDDIIFQEFKGTGNMELVLDRKLSDRRIFPAMAITQSGTRKEERILPPEVLQRVVLLRRSLVSLNPVPAMESLVKKLADYPSNAAFLER